MRHSLDCYAQRFTLNQFVKKLDDNRGSYVSWGYSAGKEKVTRKKARTLLKHIKRFNKGHNRRCQCMRQWDRMGFSDEYIIKLRQKFIDKHGFEYLIDIKPAPLIDYL
jgi:hypothetical protein